MAEMLLLALFWGFCCAVIGVAVVSVFGTDDTPFKWYFKWAFRWQESGGWRSWITSAIGGCVLCTSGQLALWSFSIVQTWNMHLSVDWAWGEMPIISFEWSEASAFLHLLAGCSGVLCAFYINRAYKWFQRRM